MMRAPVMPKGCPRAIAPPCTLSLSASMPRCRADGMTCAANASLISTRSTSSIVMPARAKAWRLASIGPRPMISGFNADSPDDTIRASGRMPSSAALVSLITTTAAAPSLSGQALPAVTVPSGRNTGLSCARPSKRRAGAGTVVLRHDGAVGQRDRRDLLGEEAVLDVGHGAVLRALGELVHLLARDVLVLRHVLSRLAHRDVDVREPLRRRPVRAAAERPLGRALAGLAEDRVRRRVAGASGVAADGLDAGGDEHVAFAGLDGVGGHADRLQARRAVAVDRHARDLRQSRQHGHDPGDVESRLTGRLAAAHDQVLDLVAGQLGHLVEERRHDLRRQVVRTDRHQRPLGRPPDRAAGSGNDDGVGHEPSVPTTLRGEIALAYCRPS